MKLNTEIQTTIGGKNFKLKFGIGFLFYVAEKENMRISTLINEISANNIWGYKLIFHGIRYFEMCNNIESLWSDFMIWDLIQIELNSENPNTNKIIEFFNTTFTNN